MGVRQVGNTLKSSVGGELGRPLWTQERILEMNEKFAEAMHGAIEAGLENCPTAVSTAAGTRCPVVGYTRPD